MWVDDFNFLPLVQYIKNYDKDLFKIIKKAKCLPVDDYIYSSTEDIIFLYQFSGKLHLPEKLDSNVFIFTFDTEFVTQPKNNIFYYCIYLFMWALVPSNIRDISLIKTNYLFCCASRNFNNYRPGKIFNYLKLKEKSYYDQILISKFKLDSPFGLYYYEKDTDFYSFVKQIEQEYYTWPTVETDLVDALWTFNLPIYNESLFHIVAETTVEDLYLSEKTYKVLNAGQIPILCARKGAVQLLRNLGFDVFDDIVDHNYYDNIEDWQLRIIQMHKVLDHLATLNHEQIKFETYQRRLYNQQRLMSVEIQKLVFDPIITQLKQHFQGEEHGC
jgi:hypothetical protein